MPDATVLVSLADLKTFIKATTSGSDGIIQSIKDGVEAAVKSYVGRDLIVTSYTEYHDGDGGSRLVLAQRPITAVTSVYADPARLFEAHTLIPASDIITGDARAWAAGIIELYQYRFLHSRKGTKVVYSAGYSTIPADLALAVKLICAKVWKIQDKSMAGQLSQTVGDQTITFSLEDWPKDAVATLKKYRRLSP